MRIRLLLLPMIMLLTAVPASAAERLPNIVIIFCDDMGYADIGPFGAKGYQTPNLNQMAKEGTIFTDFYVGRSVCSPSRASLMTGCYPLRVGVPGNFGPGSKTGLHPQEVTIAEIAKQKDYATAMYGKWHLGHKPKFLPTSQGFDEWFGLPYSNDMWPFHPEQGTLYNFPDLPLMEGKKILKKAFQPEDQVHLTTWYTERAVKFIEKNKERPFLIYLPHAMPHVPLFVSEKFSGKTKRGLYGDVIEEIDWGVGEILKALKKNGVDENTLVIFTSDNGPWLLYGDHGGSAGELREGKGTAFEGGFRVPCVMRWPGNVPAGRVCRDVAGTIDILPTISSLIGAKLPEHPIDGKNILPLIRGEKDAKSPHEAFYYYLGYNLTAVRSGRWKLFYPHTFSQPAPPGKNGNPGKRSRTQFKELSLFDLRADPGESKNLVKKHPEVVQRLEGLAEKAREDLGDRRMQRKGKNLRPVGMP